MSAYNVACVSMLARSSLECGVRVVGSSKDVGDWVLSEFMNARDALAGPRLLAARELPSTAQPIRVTRFGSDGIRAIWRVRRVGSGLRRWWMRSRRLGEAPGGLLVVHTRHVDPQSKSGNWFRERLIAPCCRLAAGRLEEYLI